MSADWIDRTIEGWAGLRPGLPVESYHVTGRIARIAARIAQRQEQLFGQHGLNRGEVGVLSALRTAGPPHRLSPTLLSRGLMLSSAGMTKRLDRLEEQGLVRRRPDPGDRRGVIVELTAAGRRLVDQVVAANTEAETDIVAGLSEEERQSLTALLRKLLRALEPPGGG